MCTLNVEMKANTKIWFLHILIDALMFVVTETKLRQIKFLEVKFFISAAISEQKKPFFKNRVKLRKKRNSRLALGDFFMSVTATAACIRIPLNLLSA